MTANPARKARPATSQEYPLSSSRNTQSPNDGFGPRPVNAVRFSGEHDQRELRTYTEKQVAGILQVSRSQLRKWRMGWSRGRKEGPPFKKLGRMIRYPESGLRAYIYGP